MKAQELIKLLEDTRKLSPVISIDSMLTELIQLDELNELEELKELETVKLDKDAVLEFVENKLDLSNVSVNYNSYDCEFDISYKNTLELTYLDLPALFRDILS